MTANLDLHVFVCEHERGPAHPRESCVARGCQDLRLWFKEAMEEAGLGEAWLVTRAGCLDRCEAGPTVVVYPQGVWYSPRSKADVAEIVASHFRAGKVVDRLLLRD